MHFHFHPLDIHGILAAENWKKFERAWINYALAIELNKKSEKAQVTTLLMVKDACEVFATFMWEDEGDSNKIETVSQKFVDYCQPKKRIPFKIYHFNCYVQEPGESYEQYRTSLRKLSER